MQAQVTRRAVADIHAVWRTGDHYTSVRWTVSLVRHLLECFKHRSLVPADLTWTNGGARFRTSTGVTVSLPATYTLGAREMYCRNVYLRSGLSMPSNGWVVDLGANRGLFSVWAALNGAQVVAVDAQQGFAEEISYLALHNSVHDKIHVEIALAGGVGTLGAQVGVVANDTRWAMTSHGASTRPRCTSIPQLMNSYGIENIKLLKIDIEGGEFAVFDSKEDLRWLEEVDQIVLEIHRDFGDATALIERLRYNDFSIDLRDNDGNQVDVTSESLNYAYCQRMRTT